MKNKYFLIIIVSIISSIGLSLLFTFYYIEKEITRSLDTQLETMASTLFASGLSVEMMNNIDDVDEMISEIFEEERVDRFIRIYESDSEKLLYANEFGQMVSLPPPSGVKLTTHESGSRHFRVLEVSNGPYILQIALMLDSFLLRMKILKKNILVFAAGLFVIIGLITALSLRALLKPLRILGQDFGRWSNQLTFDFSQMRDSTDQLVKRLKTRKREWNGGEMREFLDQLAQFCDKLSYFLQFSQNQYSILTHEIKTPLTIIRNDLERLQKELKDSDKAIFAKKALDEVDQLSKLVRNFLHWSQQAASSSKPAEIHALNLKDILQEEVQKMLTLYPGRIESTLESDLQVFCFPDHLRQLLKNLLENALTHGPRDQKIHVKLSASQLEIRDQGSGLPGNVLENLGSPFNRGQTSTGHGLGLAWCQTICDLYDWKLTFQSNSELTQHTVTVHWDPDTSLHT